MKHKLFPKWKSFQKLPIRNIPNEQIVDEINFLEEVTIDTITTKLVYDLSSLYLIKIP